MDTKSTCSRSDSGFDCADDPRLSQGDKEGEDLVESNIIDLQSIEPKIDVCALKNEILVDGMQVW